MFRWLKKHFIPHSENDYLPHILRETALVGMFALVLLTFAFANMQSLWWINVDRLISTILPAIVVAETNQERASQSQMLLARSEKLDRAAQLKAEHMARFGYFAHYAPDGTSPWHWFGAVNYQFVHAGENLAVHFNDSGEVVDAWMDSPTHRANILNGQFTEIGIGVAQGTYEGYDTLFVVQMFGTPAAVVPVVESGSGPAEPEIVANSDREFATDTSVQTQQVQVAGVQEPIEVPADITDDTVAESAAQETIVEYALPVMDTPELAVASNTPTSTEVSLARAEQFVSTSTNALAATVTSPTLPETTSFVGRIATSPQLVLQLVYGVLGTIIVLVLLAAIFIEIRRQHPLQLAYSLLLLLCMGGLYYLQLWVTSGATVI